MTVLAVLENSFSSIGINGADVRRPSWLVRATQGNTRVGKHLRREFEHLLSKHNVDVVINGHVHSYLRTCPIYNKDCVGRDYGGVVHLVIGTGGHKLSHISHHQGHWVESALVVPGYGRFDVDGANSLTFTFNNAETGKPTSPTESKPVFLLISLFVFPSLTGGVPCRGGGRFVHVGSAFVLVFGRRQQAGLS
mmetsp:Transcript_42965/g.77046  ORF Transcript_42965/g.77046 Transcript_42965/m.77046 type:complete len:193 (-) Transcript_42965:520-1098(-)